MLGICAAWMGRRPERITTGMGLLIMFPVSLAILNILSPLLSRKFSLFATAEENATGPGRTTPDQQCLARSTAQSMAGIALAGVGDILLVTSALAAPSGFRSGDARPSITLWMLGGAAMALALVAAAIAAGGKRRESSPLAMPLILLAAALWTASSLSRTRVSGFGWFAVPIVILMAAWTAESIRSNCGILQRQSLEPPHTLLSSALGIASGSSTLWAVTSGLERNGSPVSVYWSLAAFVCVTAVNATLVVAAAVTCFPSGKQDQGTNYGPVAGVCQDEALIVLLALTIAFFPAVVVAHVPVRTPERWISILLILFSFMAFFGSVFCWILRFNTRHAAFNVNRTSVNPSEWSPKDLKDFPLVPWSATAGFARTLRRSGGENQSEKDWAAALEAHVTFQNLIALGIVVAGLAPLYALINEFKVPSPD